MMRRWSSRVARALLVIGTLAGCTAQETAHEQPPEMPVLLHQAWQRAASEHGTDEAEARFATMQQRNAELKSALRTRDLQKVRQAQEALRTEQIRLIATTLGADGPRQLLDALAGVTAELRQRIQETTADGSSTPRLRTALDDAATVQAEAEAALAAGQHELALELALHAVELVTTARVAARSL